MTHNETKEYFSHQSLVMSHKFSKGFTLIELLVTLGVAAVVLGFTALSLFGTRGGQNLQNDVERLVGALRMAQQNSILQEESSEWGVCLRDYLARPSYYELYKVAMPRSGCNGIAVSRYNLGSPVFFTAPPSHLFPYGIVFERISGVPLNGAAQYVQLGLGNQQNPTERRTVEVKGNGAIRVF